MFTGKNKEQFEKWYEDNNRFMLRSDMFGLLASIRDFHHYLPFTMQLGVYLEYLDSVRMFIRVEDMEYYNGQTSFNVYINNERIKCESNFPATFPSRPEALTEALKKVDELINNQLA